jgi:hypothetical protein
MIVTPCNREWEMRAAIEAGLMKLEANARVAERRGLIASPA